MSDPLEICEPEDALEFLDSFASSTRRKGEAYLREGRVGSLKCITACRNFEVKVQGSEPYNVSLYHDENEGWDGSCTCPIEFDCKHVYAAMKALVSRSGHAPPKISIAPPPPAPTPPPKPAPPTPPNNTLAQKLAAALGRSLRAEESRFLRKLSEVYQRCSRTRSITGWDLDELGFHFGGYVWDGLRLWPSFPKDEEQFWLYLANAAQERGKPIPAFMAAVTDVTPIRDQIERWKRTQEIERWRGVLESTPRHFQGSAAVASISSSADADLRLRLTSKGAELQWRRPGREEFEPVKQTHFRQITDDHAAGSLQFPPEAELLWQTFEQRFFYGRSTQLSYHEEDAKKALSRLCRLRWLDSRLVNEEGQPFQRASEPLRWAVTPADDDRGDYRIQLVQADGAPPPPVLVTLPGRPALYITAAAVFAGPAGANGVLNPASPNVIPAPALESQVGVEFLHKLGVELPPRVRDRIRQIPVSVRIVCSLKPSYPGSTTEACVVKVFAQSPDEVINAQWMSSGWYAADGRTKKPKENKDGYITLYDRATMDEAPRLIQPLGLKWDGYQGQFSLRVTKKFPDAFVPWLKSLPPHVAVHLDGELATLANSPIAGNVKLEAVEAGVDWFDLKVVLDVSDTELTGEELKLLLDAKGRYVRLGKKGWRKLQFNLTEEEDERLAQLGLNPHELSSEPQRLHALQLADEAAKRFLPEEQVVQIQRRAGEIKTRVTPDLPTEVRAELRPYQRDGFHFLAYLSTNRFGGILADDMGLGKTVQTLTWLIWLRAQPENAAKPSLVVCPKSVMDNWRAEAERFTPGLRVKVWPASELETFLNRLAEADLHVLNYSQLRIIGESLTPVAWLAVILDEGQYIKNPNSQTAQVARSLRADHRLALSGTPIENRLLDLWSLMAFAMPGVLGSRAQFARLFDAKEDPFARRRLAARVRPFLLRRTKSQVAKDLPDRIEEDLYCEIEGEQKTLYRAELKNAQQMLLKIKTQTQLSKERFHFLTSLLRLRQICCHPVLVKPNSKAESAKVEALLDQLEPLVEEGHKVLVFSQFVGMLDLLRATLTEKGWPLFYLAGATENRADLVQRFQSAEGAAVFLISLKAGGFGLNLTAASYVVLFDPWWNPAVENQAIDRTHRIGQISKVIAYRLLIKDSIEEKIRQLQRQKSALVEDVLGEEKFAQSLSLEDLQFLFAD